MRVDPNDPDAAPSGGHKAVEMLIEMDEEAAERCGDVIAIWVVSEEAKRARL